MQNQPLQPNYEYQAGGSLAADAVSYVFRRADQDFYEGLKQGEFCYVLNARQMGKSSLRVRTIRRLRAEGIACATIDITEIGATDVTSQEWYAGIIDIIANDFKLVDFDVDDWWQTHRLLSPVHHLAKFIEDILLVQVQQTIVIFIDETDAIRRFGEDFFALVRSCYNLRPDKPAYRRLTFAILGVVSPADLIADKKRTPFNIGHAIDLTGFELAEAESLALGLPALEPLALLETILAWTGGQPFLTQKLCKLVCRRDTPLPAGSEAAWLEQLVRDEVIKNWEYQDEPPHLRHIRDRILHEGGQYSGGLLGLYQNLLQRGELPADDSREQIELRFAGLVVRRANKLLVYNRIYAEVFTQTWVTEQLAKLRPYAASFQAWVASGYKDKSRLLQGQALQEAQTWAEGKSLSDADHKFLTASTERALRLEMQAERLQAQRRAILGLVGFVGVTAGLAFWGYLAQQQAWKNAELAKQQEAIAVQQKELAKQQEAIAVQQRDIALDAISKRTYKWVDKLVQLPRTQEIVTEILTDNTVLLDQIYALDSDVKEAQREKASSLSRVGNSWLLLGNTEKALQAYQQSLEISQKLATDDPTNYQVQRDLSVSLNKIGNVQLQLGNTEKALQAYQQSLEISQKLATDDPTNSQDQRDLSISFEKLGNVQLQIGNTEKALQAYQQSLEISQKLATNNPTNFEAQRDLSVSFNYIGNVQLQLGNTKKALQAYQQYLEISQKLASDDPTNSQTQRDLSISLNKIGNVQLQLGNTEKALQAYQQMLEILQKLASDDPTNFQAQRNLSVGLDRIGDVQLQLGNTEKALQAYQQSLEIRQKLATNDPTNFQTQRDLLVSYYKLGTIQKEPAITRQYYQQALAIAEKLAAQDKANQQAQNDLRVLRNLVSEQD